MEHFQCKSTKENQEKKMEEEIQNEHKMIAYYNQKWLRIHNVS